MLLTRPTRLRFDPTSYFVLMQFRVVVTGVLYQLIFKKSLTLVQWLSLILLTSGCIMQRLVENDTGNMTLDINVYLVLILAQVLSSCFSGVYTEKLLKERSAPVMVQNSFLCLNSIFCNLVLLTYNGQLFTFLTWEDNMAHICTFKVIYIIINSTFIGIVVSLFLRYLNSILKSFASALEIVFTAVLAYIFFGVPIGMSTIFSICLICIATYLYSANPVNNSRAGKIVNLNLSTVQANGHTELREDKHAKSREPRGRVVSSGDKV